MARICIGGREIEVPTDAAGNVDVSQVRQAAGVSPVRALIRQLPSGQNAIVQRRGQIRLNPYEYFLDAPIARRGKTEGINTFRRYGGVVADACLAGQCGKSCSAFVTDFRLPSGYKPSSIPVLVVIPKNYPDSPPKTIGKRR